MGFNNFLVVNFEGHRSGRQEGLNLLWNDFVSISLEIMSEHHIDAKIEVSIAGNKWLFIGFYGWKFST